MFNRCYLPRDERHNYGEDGHPLITEIVFRYGVLTSLGTAEEHANERGQRQHNSKHDVFEPIELLGDQLFGRFHY